MRSAKPRAVFVALIRHAHRMFLQHRDRTIAMFFSFEGIDGSGKSTQARLLASALRKRGHTVVEVREPGGTALGERVRALLLDPEADISGRAELLLFSAARAQLVEMVVQPALAAGAVVIADRFHDSATAYQGGGRRLADPTWLEVLHCFATAGTLPDRTYLVDVDLVTAAARRGDPSGDRMEQSGEGFFGRVRNAYHAIVQAHPDRILAVDGLERPDVLHALVLDDALQHMA